MTTFTLPGIEKAMSEMGQIMQGRLPREALKPVLSKAVPIMQAASASSGGIKAKTFKVKGPSNKAGYSSAAVVGYGFAVLDEFGSYKKPNGYPEAPKKAGKRQINNKRASYETRARAAARAFGYSKSMLGNKATGFAAAYVHHPAQKAHPYQGRAQALIGAVFDSAAEKATLEALKRVRLG